MHNAFVGNLPNHQSYEFLITKIWFGLTRLMLGVDPVTYKAEDEYSGVFCIFSSATQEVHVLRTKLSLVLIATFIIGRKRDI